MAYRRRSSYRGPRVCLRRCVLPRAEGESVALYTGLSSIKQWVNRPCCDEVSQQGLEIAESVQSIGILPDFIHDPHRPVQHRPIVSASTQRSFSSSLSEGPRLVNCPNEFQTVSFDCFGLRRPALHSCLKFFLEWLGFDGVETQ